MSNELVIRVTSENFKDFINSDIPCLVDFWASWCGPCRMLGPVIDELASDYQGKIKVGKINIDEEIELAKEFRVMTIPTVVIFKNGEIADKNVGAVPKEELEDFIEKNL